MTQQGSKPIVQANYKYSFFLWNLCLYVGRFGSNFWNDGATGLQIQPPSSIVNLNNREKQRKPKSFISLKHAATKLEHFCWVVYFLTELLMEINREDCENACQSRKISNNTSEIALS